MSDIRLEPVPGSHAALKLALSVSGLPIEDVEDPGRSFFRALSSDGGTVGYAGIETCGDAVLLRSMVILPEHRGRSLGSALTNEMLKAIDPASTVFLATTTAEPFFAKLGFVVIERGNVPPAVLTTRQLSGICPASATIMQFNRPPT
ncbi:arsenic resistance N-acetyltransferase ArsN2 (plasmid) [Ensifer adhaerens]|uniref:arsenic resistance N-acetyltransferase ArsN2 n=1 Tax=Ensifer adhaerens TaxID=106592 RepID=UPI001CBC8045|nr:arsenic resistance N-acetyltransferase ArsN2 [Ensifer adhaerens]MBZ7927558.1 arsenic resistance N-acetyltransferase ArsN2 [Ensifer adhaerens]UAX97970.1 arsenic resistance N-acetyltransferase ArsN2 [Ensifer adhaerens]UAY05350.1 arsenic resistance N-acetyltransferase ArsN2 [Ensifer adhaerens]UAY12728.1 arsenic resistance N-acetyltransferase ArsN2 [Ensifer adhaerens]